MTDNYLTSIQVGDIVLPIEDGKCGRYTKCKVIEITSNYITVEGPLWGQSIWIKEEGLDIDLEFITKFNRTTGENYSYRYKANPLIMLDTTTEYICDEEDDVRGDYYCLLDISSCDVLDKWVRLDLSFNWLRRLLALIK